MAPEGLKKEQHDLSPRARRFLEVGIFLTAMLAASPKAEAGDSRSPENAWAQLMGENSEERVREINKLERACSTLEAKIAMLESRLDEGGNRYVRDPGLKFKEQGELRDAERDLRQKEAAIERLRKGAERSAERAAERRGNRSEAVDGTILEFMDPTLDLSAKKLGNADVAAYYAQNKIGWKDHALYFDALAGTPDGERLSLKVGPEMTDADFFFQDGRKDLLIVFTTNTGGHKALLLDDGSYGGYYDSDEHGKPVPMEIQE